MEDFLLESNHLSRITSVGECSFSHLLPKGFRCHRNSSFQCSLIFWLLMAVDALVLPGTAPYSGPFNLRHAPATIFVRCAVGDQVSQWLWDDCVARFIINFHDLIRWLHHACPPVLRSQTVDPKCVSCIVGIEKMHILHGQVETVDLIFSLPLILIPDCCSLGPGKRVNSKHGVNLRKIMNSWDTNRNSRRKSKSLHHMQHHIETRRSLSVPAGTRKGPDAHGSPNHGTPNKWWPSWCLWPTFSPRHVRPKQALHHLHHISQNQLLVAEEVSVRLVEVCINTYTARHSPPPKKTFQHPLKSLATLSLLEKLLFRTLGHHKCIRAFSFTETDMWCPSFSPKQRSEKLKMAYRNWWCGIIWERKTCGRVKGVSNRHNDTILKFSLGHSARTKPMFAMIKKSANCFGSSRL